MIRKWEWIREYCKRLGFERTAEIADKIDRVMCYVYGGYNTKEWEEYMESGRDGITETGGIDMIMREVSINIIGNISFCTACREDRNNIFGHYCDECRFDALTGVWGKHRSLYMLFNDSFNGGR